jgi:hypothetical protein
MGTCFVSTVVVAVDELVAVVIVGDRRWAEVLEVLHMQRGAEERA